MKNDKNFGSMDIKYLDPSNVSDTTVNIGIGFKEALHLHLALGECLQKLNRYHMGTTQGKKATVKLVVYGQTNRIMVTEG